MAIFGPIVEMAADPLAVFISDFFHSGAVRTKPISDNRFLAIHIASSLSSETSVRRAYRGSW